MHSTIAPSLRALLLLLPFTAALLPSTRADYADIVAAFLSIRDDTIFPVPGATFDDIEETFGPRAQPSLAGSYDWHRGIDIDGALGADVVAAYDGTFEKIDYSTSAGNYVVIKHTLPTSVTFGPNPDHDTWTTFYTYYLHLTDETVTFIQNQNWAKGDAISAGTVIGYLGATGTSGGTPYAPHLHFELRFGTSNPLENQIAVGGLSTTDAWFDPHLHPLLLFNPADPVLRGASSASTYAQTLALLDPAATSGEIPASRVVLYTSSLDELPILNALQIAVRDTATDTVVASHVLDFNQRIGFDASTNELLDTRDFSVPFLVPDAFTDSATDYTTRLYIPDSWLAAYNLPGYVIDITATDIWGAATSLSFAAVPEPAASAALAGLGVLALAARRRRRAA